MNFAIKWVLVSLLSLPVFSAEKVEEKIEKKIVILGDSITAGLGIAKKDAYPSLLEKKLNEKGYKVKVVNSGVSGATTAGGQAQLRWQLRAPIDVLIIALGANDGLRGLKLKKSKENIVSLIKVAREKKMRVLLIGNKIPRNYGEKYWQEFEKMFEDTAKEQKVALVPFLLKDVGAVKELNLADGIHPNEKGHVKIADNLLPHIEKMLK